MTCKRHVLCINYWRIYFGWFHCDFSILSVITFGWIIVFVEGTILTNFRIFQDLKLHVLLLFKLLLKLFQGACLFFICQLISIIWFNKCSFAEEYEIRDLPLWVIDHFGEFKIYPSLQGSSISQVKHFFLGQTHLFLFKYQETVRVSQFIEHNIIRNCLWACFDRWFWRASLIKS